MDKRMKCNRAVAVACGLLMITCGRASCTPKPVYGTWGLDFAGEDRVTKPGDDFFRFANGAWLDRTQIPADKSAVGSAWTMSDLTEARLHDMMEQFAAKATHQPSDLEGKVGAFYSHSWTKRVSSN
jgi:putative endopeptidase